MFELTEIATLKDKLDALKSELIIADNINKVLKRALLIACNGDTVKAVECIDKTITEPENPNGR